MLWSSLFKSPAIAFIKLDVKYCSREYSNLGDYMPIPYFLDIFDLETQACVIGNCKEISMSINAT